jgi:hypothetical protein
MCKTACSQFRKDSEKTRPRSHRHMPRLSGPPTGNEAKDRKNAKERGRRLRKQVEKQTTSSFSTTSVTAAIATCRFEGERQ